MDGVIFLKHYKGQNTSNVIVKFAFCTIVSGGVKCHRSFMCSRFIEIMKGSEQQWVEFGGSTFKEGDIPMKTEDSSPRGVNDRHLKKKYLIKNLPEDHVLIPLLDFILT